VIAAYLPLPTVHSNLSHTKSCKIL
jgi:hypothetical protein